MATVTVQRLVKPDDITLALSPKGSVKKGGLPSLAPDESERFAHQCTALGMTAAELKHVMAANKQWPHPAHEDGWVMIHNCIRLDMDEVLAAINKTAKQLQADQPLATWQVRSFQRYYGLFYGMVHKHHHAEEDMVFPWIQSRVQVPEKMSDDHVTLMAQMDRCRDILAGLKAGQTASQQATAFRDLQTIFAAFRSHMREHLQEEEDIALPLMRKHFTFAELQVVEKKMLKGATPAHLAYFLWPVQGIAAKRAIMTRFGIPKMIQRLVMEPAIAKDELTRQRMVRELKHGRRDAAPMPDSCLGRAAMRLGRTWAKVEGLFSGGVGK